MPRINTLQLIDKSITKEKLSDDVQSKLNNIGTVSSLKTYSKNTLVDSINELYNNTINGKNLIKQAIQQKGVALSGGGYLPIKHCMIKY